MSGTRIEADAHAAQFIRESGGRFFVWSRGVQATDPPMSDSQYHQYEADGFTLLVDRDIEEPSLWRLVYHETPRPHVRPLWNDGQPPPTILASAPYCEAPPFHVGDRFEVTDETRVDALTHWRAPVTDGFTTTLPKGLVVVAAAEADDDWRTWPGLSVVPEEYDRWEEQLVPAHDLARRDDPRGYAGFHLVFKIADIGTRLRRLPGSSKPRK